MVQPDPISIHAPAWGATIQTGHGITLRSYFNPRTRVGCDVFLSDYDIRVLQISIHAPAWGATVMFRRIRYALVISIHAPAWGATQQAEIQAG